MFKNNDDCITDEQITSTVGISKETPKSLPDWDDIEDNSLIAYTTYDKDESN